MRVQVGMLEAAELEKRQLREQLQQQAEQHAEQLRTGGAASSLLRTARRGAGGKPGKPGAPGMRGSGAGLCEADALALEAQTKQLREMKLSKTCITPDDLHDVMRGALAEALGLDEGSGEATRAEATRALAAAITSLNKLNPADMKATFPGAARAWTGPAGYLQPVHGVWLTDWRDASKFESKMKELDALLR